jgi:hypothetical protein
MLVFTPAKAVKQAPRDVNQLAKLIVDIATGEASQTDPIPVPPDIRNPAAVARGRLGGLKGGKARAKSLPPSVAKKLHVRPQKVDGRIGNLVDLRW